MFFEHHVPTVEYPAVTVDLHVFDFRFSRIEVLEHIHPFCHGLAAKP